MSRSPESSRSDARTRELEHYIAHVLWPDGIPEGSVLARTTLHRGTTTTAFESPEALASSWVEHEERVPDTHNVFFALGAIRASKVSRYVRGSSDDVVAVPAIFADIDIRGGDHSGKNDPLPTHDEVRKLWPLLRQIGLEPSHILSSSPGGAYALWIFREAFEIEGVADRARYQGMARGVQAAVRWALSHIAGEPRHLDSTADLARLLRPPGAFNKKQQYRAADGGFARVATVNESDRRYNPSDIEDILAMLGEEHRLNGAGTGGAPFTGELPKEIPPWVELAAKTLGNVAGAIESDEGVRGVKFRLCPCCGGAKRNGGTDEGTAWITPLSGRLRCYRQSCGAKDEGFTFEQWSEELLNPEEREAIQVLREQARPSYRIPHRLDPDTPAMTIHEAYDGGVRKAIRNLLYAPEYAGKIVLADPPTGSGKTRANAELIAEDPSKIAAFVGSYRLRDELVAAVRTINPNVPLFLPEGVSQACLLGPETLGPWGAKYDENGAMIVRPKVPTYWRKKSCSGCPLRGECAAHAKPKKGDAIIAVSHLDGGIPDPEFYKMLGEVPHSIMTGRTTIYDESPSVTEALVVSAKDLRDPLERPKLYTDYNKDDEQKAAIEKIVRDGSKAIAAILNRRVAARQKAVAALPKNDAARRFDERQTLTADDCTEDEIAALRLLARDIDHGDLFQSTGDTLRAGAKPDSVPNGSLPKVWRQLARVTGAVPETGDPASSLRLVIGEDRAAVEIVTPRPVVVPEDGRALILDATATFEWAPIAAANPGRDVACAGINVEGDREAAPVHRIWVQTRGVSRSSLLDGGALPTSRAERRRSLGRIRNPLRLAAQAARGLGLSPSELSTGLLAYKPIAEALESDPGALVTARADAGGFNLDPSLIGYWGGHSRGTNRFERARCLVTVGACWPNIGAAQHEGEALGLDNPGGLAMARMYAELEQGLGRIRPLAPSDEPRLLVHIGAEVPASWAGDPDVIRRSVTPEDEAEDEAIETALAPLRSGIPLLVEALWRSMRRVVLREIYSTRRIETSRPGQHGREAAMKFAERVVERARAEGFEVVIERVRIPGRRGGKPPLALRPANVPVIEAGRRLAETLAERSAEAAEESFPAYVLPRPEAPAVAPDQAGCVRDPMSPAVPHEGGHTHHPNGAPTPHERPPAELVSAELGVDPSRGLRNNPMQSEKPHATCAAEPSLVADLDNPNGEGQPYGDPAPEPFFEDAHEAAEAPAGWSMGAWDELGVVTASGAAREAQGAQVVASGRKRTQTATSYHERPRAAQEALVDAGGAQAASERRWEAVEAATPEELGEIFAAGQAFERGAQRAPVADVADRGWEPSSAMFERAAAIEAQAAIEAAEFEAAILDSPWAEVAIREDHERTRESEISAAIGAPEESADQGVPEDPFAMRYEPRLSPLPSASPHGSIYVPAEVRDSIAPVVALFVTTLGVDCTPHDLRQALPEFVPRNAPPGSGLAALARRLNGAKEPPSILDLFGVAEAIATDALLDGAFGDAGESADPRVDQAFSLGRPGGLIPLGPTGWPRFTDHDTATIERHTRGADSGLDLAASG